MSAGVSSAETLFEGDDYRDPGGWAQ